MKTLKQYWINNQGEACKNIMIKQDRLYIYLTKIGIIWMVHVIAIPEKEGQMPISLTFSDVTPASPGFWKAKSYEAYHSAKLVQETNVNVEEKVFDILKVPSEVLHELLEFAWSHI